MYKVGELKGADWNMDIFSFKYTIQFENFATKLPSS